MSQILEKNSYKTVHVPSIVASYHQRQTSLAKTATDWKRSLVKTTHLPCVAHHPINGKPVSQSHPHTLIEAW